MTINHGGSDDADEVKRINDQLLRRRAEAKAEATRQYGDCLDAIETHIRKGDYANARQIANRLRETPLFKEVIILFQEKPETFACGGCVNKVDGLRFNRETLTWLRPRLCETCEQREMEIAVDMFKRSFGNFIQRNLVAILNTVGVEGLLLKASYEGFPESVVHTCKRSVMGKHGLYITGGVGRGKSWLSVALLKDLIENVEISKEMRRRLLNDVNGFRELCRFVYVPRLLMEIKSSYDNNSSMTEQGIIEEYTRLPILVLDDIGSERPTEWVREKLNMIIYFRNIRGLKTIYTSNSAPEGLQERLDERITSRILQQCEVIQLTGPDRRRQ